MYLSLKGRALVVASRLYKPELLLVQNDAGGVLHALAPGDKFEKTILIRLPVPRTAPLYERDIRQRKPITTTDFDEIVVEWGVFAQTSALDKLIESKVERGRVNGLELVPTISSGKEELLNLQVLVRAAAKL